MECDVNQHNFRRHNMLRTAGNRWLTGIALEPPSSGTSDTDDWQSHSGSRRRVLTAGC